jgi:hypothetical protein
MKHFEYLNCLVALKLNYTRLFFDTHKYYFYLSYLMDIVQATDNWINQKVATNSIAIIRILKKCVIITGEQLEAVKLGMTLDHRTKLADINPSRLADYLNRDLIGARKGLQVYKLTENMMTNRIASISSNFGLRKFAEVAMIDLKGTNFATLNKHVRGFETVVIDPIKEHFAYLVEIIIDLKEGLELQIKELEILTSTHPTNLSSEIKRLHRVDTLFQKELKDFALLQKSIPFPDNILRKYDHEYKKFAIILRNKALGFKRHFTGEWKRDTKEADQLQKALVLARYFFTTGFFLYNFKVNALKIVGGRGGGLLKRKMDERRNHRDEERVRMISATSQQMDAAISAGTLDAIVDAATKIAA